MDIISQMKLVLSQNLGAIESYQMEIILGKRKGDFISRQNFVENMKSKNVLHIHLLMSTDGGDHTQKKRHFMPLVWIYHLINGF